MFLLSILSVIAVFIIYQFVFYWLFKDPVSISASINKTYPDGNKPATKEIKFKIINRINKAFAIEKVIIKIDDHHHILDNPTIIMYPSLVNGFETYTIKLPTDYLIQLAKKDIEDWHKMLMKVSITIRGNNASYRSNQIQFN